MKIEPWGKKIEKKQIKWFGHLMMLDVKCGIDTVQKTTRKTQVYMDWIDEKTIARN